MPDHGTRPEFEEALTASSGAAIHYSIELGKHMVYVAIPVARGRQA